MVKKLLAVIFSISMILPMVGCSGNGNMTGTVAEENEEEAETGVSIEDIDMSDVTVVDQSLVEALETDAQGDNGESVMEEISDVVADATGANQENVVVEGAQALAMMKKALEIAMSSTKKDPYGTIIENLNEIKESLKKLDTIEQDIQNLSAKLDMKEVVQALDARKTQRDAVSNACLNVLDSFHNLAMKDGTYNENWFEDNYDQVSALLEEWGNKTVNGNTMTVELLNFLDLYSRTFTDQQLSYPQMYDKIAYQIYPWEHEGYTFRENARMDDLTIMLEVYMLGDLYYKYKAIENPGIDRTAFVNQIKDKVNKYLTYFDETQVVHHDDVRICQIPGCEYTFQKRIDIFDKYNDFRNIFRDHDFDALTNNQQRKNQNAIEMKNALYGGNTYTDVDLTQNPAGYGGYEFIPAEIYMKIYKYYQERNKTASKEKQCSNFCEILQQAGFDYADGLVNSSKEVVFITPYNQEYNDHGDGFIGMKNYLDYLNYHICISQKGGQDSVDLRGMYDKNMNLKTGKDAEVIKNCNFHEGEYMNSDGYNANLAICSLNGTKTAN